MHFHRLFIILVFTSATLSLSSDGLPNFSIQEKEARTQFTRGFSYFNNSQYSSARENFLKALSIKNDFTLARLLLSNSYYLSGDWPESMSELEQIEDTIGLNQIQKARLDALRINLAGGSQDLTVRYYSAILGDELRRFRFRNPSDVAVDDDGFLYVLSFDTANIVKFDPNGNPIDNFKGSLGRNLTGPLFFSLRANSIFVADFKADKIYEFNTRGEYINRFGSSGKTNGAFHGPTGIFYTKNGYLYVSDSGNNRIQKLKSDGTFVQEIGVGILRNPSGLKINSKGEIYVADRGNSRIAVFDPEGNFLREITNPNILSSPRNLTIRKNEIYISDEKSGLVIYNTIDNTWRLLDSFRDSKNVVRKLNQPFSSTFDYTGTQFIADFNRHRVEIFSPSNQLSSNMDVVLEKVLNHDYPDISVFLRVRDRSGRDIKTIPRNSFKVYEYGNLSPLIGLTDMRQFNNRISLSLVYENTSEVKAAYPVFEKSLRPLLTSLRQYDGIEVLRSGTELIKASDFNYSMHEIFRILRTSPSDTSSKTGKAIYRGISDLLGRLGPRIVLVLVSGNSYPDSFTQISSEKIIRYSKAHSIPIYFLSLSDSGSAVETYKMIAASTGGKFILIPGEGSEKNLYNSFLSHKDRRYIVSFKSRIDADKKDFYIPLVIEANFRNTSGKTEAGFFTK
ncbi:NHL repeat protein [Leptospira interrogans str. 2003000735]|uniref:NHL repeat protein n=1 Tax=Leptospira interrogans serovar Australis str. 200703203 TaxID=1085541 RepID=N1UGY2_LEPIR|nr:MULTISPECIES: NHL repeat-containing protein [Leptospira]EMY24132.1 NHL repeat protein [Leptospira interrogans serovar Australis str. 200703203]EKN88229.1 NHL repeat protein [Leptospira interrogans str. 2002000624]EKQ37462.1 NHL repeat protein [Leptospira interrogans str. 2002000621]EKQ46198.1 NHL repeat protein [Leptospira interrogans str. 2002000623]EMJ68546.1 NHL repeat protein [Leptospira interrogans str. 2002000632]